MANEKRLIDANALKKTLDNLEAQGGHKYYRAGANCILHEIMPQVVDDQPTVDAVEVVHGTWLVDDYDSGDPGYYSAFIEVHCSKCGYNLGAESGEYGWLYCDPFPMNYCPNCGAKMDGGNEDA